MKNFLPLIFIFPVSLYGQPSQDKMKAFKVGQEGSALMSEGRYNDAILKFEEAATYDTDNYSYPYYIAYSYIRQKEITKATETISAVISNFEDAPEQCFQMLGNLYDEQGHTEKALEIYDEGLKKYPCSGRLYMEKGIVLAYRENETEKALECWEKGIKEQPDFPSNYYWAAKVYCNSKNKLWGIFYGEIFLHLESNTQRAVEISAYIYDAYVQGIHVVSKEISINFTDQSCTNSFATAFEEELWKSARIALKRKRFLNMETICKVRLAFLTSWLEKGYNEKFENILIDYQERLSQAGFCNSYTYWLMKEGDKKAFREWKIEHEQEYNDFIIWLESNPLTPGKKNCFYRMQYNKS